MSYIYPVKARNLICFLFVLLLCTFVSNAQSSIRKELFDSEWRFYLGNAVNAEQPDYDDSSWRLLHLPHDWSIEPLKEQIPGETIGPFSKKSPGGSATGQTIGGEGWYRKTFVISPEDTGKRHELYFEGIFNQSEIWINGKKAYYNVYGYTTFRFDITPYCNPAGQENVIAVRVLNEGKNSRWYTGSGIYRHVWMIRTSVSHIDDWGTFITTNQIANKQADLSLMTTVINGEKNEANFDVHIEIISPAGKPVSKVAQSIKVTSGDTLEIPFHFQVKNPKLWSVDTPDLYTSRISLWKGGIRLDEITIPFGIRTISFSVENGFQLNGIKMKLKGGCVHHDNGLLGSASFDRAEERKIEVLKANGYNAVRGSHNPMSESFMSACDRVGMLVIDEAFDQWRGKKNPQDYNLYFDEWSAKDIRNLVLRDRNHPSVIMWSIGNEIRERITEEGKNTAGYLKNEILKYDHTRPVTAGVNKYWNKDRTEMLPLDNAFYHLDIAGYNYMWRFYEEDHKKFPQRIMFGSESVATEASQNWDKVEKHTYVIGDFIWTAMDYLGESGIGNSLEIEPEENVHQFMDWPWFNGWCGDIDLLGIKKPQSYYRDILWRKCSISMAVEVPVAEGKIRKVSFWGWPEEQLSWTFLGMENKLMKVNVYTRAPQVRLYLNHTLIEEKAVNELYIASFEVPYEKGTLKAVEVNNNKEGKSVVLATIGKAAALRLTADKTKLSANGQDLSYVLIELVDKKGNVVYDSQRKIQIVSKGSGSAIIASGTASPNDMHSFRSLTPTLFNGRAMVILRSDYQPGQFELTVTSEGMKPSTIKINSK